VIALTGQLCTVLCVRISVIYTVQYWRPLTYIIRKCRTIGIIGPSPPHISPCARGGTVLELVNILLHLVVLDLCYVVMKAALLVEGVNVTYTS
jgi:hypothetical protein